MNKLLIIGEFPAPYGLYGALYFAGLKMVLANIMRKVNYINKEKYEIKNKNKQSTSSWHGVHDWKLFIKGNQSNYLAHICQTDE